MKTIYTELHKKHHGKSELINGALSPCFEMPSRAEMVLARIQKMQLGEIISFREFGLDPVRRVHTQGFVDFLASAWEEWSALGNTHDALPLIWPVRGLRTDRVPRNIDGKLGYYSMDAGVPITAGTWEAVKSSANVALTGGELLLAGAGAVFSLCRPPGHHAASDYMGGYCYLNNAAIAAQYFRDNGVPKVAILDVDYHHGNGTQSIFYNRGDVLFCSIHGDPADEYPHFLGYADETGEGAGVGCTINYPLALGSDWQVYNRALDQAKKNIAAYAPEVLLVSLGVDTYKDDPISQFKLTNDDYVRMGESIGQLQIPTQFVFEGGYAVEAIGVNVVNVLLGFQTTYKGKIL